MNRSRDPRRFRTRPNAPREFVATLYERVAENGERYFYGFVGGKKLLLFLDGTGHSANGDRRWRLFRQDLSGRTVWLTSLEDRSEARLRALRALALVLARPHAGELIQALQPAEGDPVALPEALALLDSLPALARRRVLANYAVLTRPVR